MGNRIRYAISTHLYHFQLSGLMLIIGLLLTTHSVRAGLDQTPAALTIGTSSASVCAGTSVTLTASGCPANGTLRWSTSQTGAVVVVVPAQTTTYSVLCSVTSTSVVTTTAVSSSATSTTSLVTNTVSTSASATVRVSAAISVSATVTPVSCNLGDNGRVVVVAGGGTGALQYQFNNRPFQTGATFDRLVAGTYPIVVRDAAGCTVQTSAQVRQPDALSLTITAVGAKCTGGADGGIVAVASGGNGGYRYFLDGVGPRESGTFLDLKGGTTYTIGLADRNDCVLFQSVTVTAPAAFSVQLTAQPTKCVGSVDGSISVVATGGTGAYQYQIGTNAFQTGSQFTGLSANTYDITVRDGNGCETRRSVAVGQPAPLRLSAVSRPVNCFGPTSGTITVSNTGGTGAVTYRLATSQASQASNTFVGVGVGTYTIIGTDANGCSELVSATVTQAAPIKVQATPTPASCCVCPTGAVQLTSTGGSGTVRQYQLIGQPYQPGSLIGGLRPNTYRLRVADEVGCTDSVVAVITDANALTLATGTVKNTPCAGGSEGEATVQVSGGTRPFTYYWLTERRDTLRNRTATQTALAEGTYTVSVLDSNRCTTSTVFVTIRATNPLPFKPVIQLSGGTLLVDQTAGIQWYVRQGTNPARAVPNATRPILVPFESGQYFAVITANGCSSPPSDAIDFVLTATAEPVSDFRVQISPNPVRDQLRVEIEQISRSAVRLQLVDISGRSVWQQQLSAFTGKKQANWLLSGIPAGQYVLQADADNRRAVVRVIVE
ncbi:T9SS type A sorting domain-containing protein [Spirosoma lacussanchae]|uniref:T9SS type A sorting domain-containing protein n=1 Tax=Spirosoma lacussanchae TaxID=1884249 RepID=UPI001FE8BFC0|nr:T9SS type A sorting domain-containing protein [Spirosoma lacussanchae]